MNLPNKITVARVIAAPAVVALMYVGAPWAGWCALALFVLASISDLVDGHIARSRGLITDFGKFVDPIADKVLITAAMLMLVAQGERLPAWALFVFLAREFVIAAFRMLAASKGAVIAAGRLGKYKTFSQTLAVAFAMAFAPNGGERLITFAPGEWAATALMWIALVFAVWSCVDYIVKNKSVLEGERS